MIYSFHATSNIYGRKKKNFNVYTVSNNQSSCFHKFSMISFITKNFEGKMFKRQPFKLKAPIFFFSLFTGEKLQKKNKMRTQVIKDMAKDKFRNGGTAIIFFKQSSFS